MASLPRWVEREIEDTPFSDMRVVDPGFLTDESELNLSQTSGCNPGLYTNYKKKAAPKAKPKGK